MKLLFFLMILLLSLSIAYLILIIPRFSKPDFKSLLNHYYAHRGLYNPEKQIPENSMTAFRLAVEKGFGIEADVRLSKDGIPVIFHDATLSRMCGIDRNVSDLTLSQLKELSLGGSGERIPTFHEFLELVAGKVPLIVEIKMEKRDDRLPDTMNRLLADYKGAYCIESFHPSALIWYRKHRPDVFRGQLCTNFNKENKRCSLPFFLLGKMLTNIAARPDFIAYNWKYKNDLSRRLCCNFYHALPVAWTIRSQEELNLCRKDFRLFIFEGFLPQS